MAPSLLLAGEVVVMKNHGGTPKTTLLRQTGTNGFCGLLPLSQRNCLPPISLSIVAAVVWSHAHFPCGYDYHLIAVRD